jgi:hypothetical protein
MLGSRDASRSNRAREFGYWGGCRWPTRADSGCGGHDDAGTMVQRVRGIEGYEGQRELTVTRKMMDRGRKRMR